MASERLRAVAPDERPAPSVPFTVSTAASDGTYRDLLVAMRDRVATAVTNPDTPARDLAALTRRLMDIARDIEALDVREKEDNPGGVGSGEVDTSFDASAV